MIDQDEQIEKYGSNNQEVLFSFIRFLSPNDFGIRRFNFLVLIWVSAKSSTSEDDLVPKVAQLHSWDMTTSEARALQIELAGRVASSTPISEYETIGASDVSFNRKGEWIFATVVVVRAGSFELIEQSGAVMPATFPYVPGLLSFREAPAVIKAYEALKTRPDVFICDGQGIAHPRRIGLASHIGLWLGIPTIGCAKSRLIGTFREPGPNPGDWTPLIDHEETIGAVLRTRAKVNPLFVSPAHLSDLNGSIATVLSTIRKYRLPVPIRMAHQYVNELRIQGKPEALDDDSYRVTKA